jgi:glutathione S-transferase
MKLYYTPGACSMAAHIMLDEIGATYDVVNVDLKTKKTADGLDFNSVNPKGYVPALEVEKGKLLTEDGIILQYLADQKPEAQLIGKPGSWDRIRQLEAVHFIATEVHKSFGPLFDPTNSDEVKTKFKKKIEKRLEYMNKMITPGGFAMGAQYTLVDPYLFTMMTWVKGMGIDANSCTQLQAHYEKVRHRPATEKALKAENLNTKL